MPVQLWLQRSSVYGQSDYGYASDRVYGSYAAASLTAGIKAWLPSAEPADLIAPRSRRSIHLPRHWMKKEGSDRLRHVVLPSDFDALRTALQIGGSRSLQLLSVSTQMSDIDYCAAPSGT